MMSDALKGGELGGMQDMLDRRIADAKAAECGPKGHMEVVGSLGDVALCFRYLAAMVEQLPERISERMRSDVVRLVQAHADDAVKRALGSRLPGVGMVGTATPGWREIGRKFAATLAGSPWAIVGVVGLFAVSPSLRELVRALVGAMK